MSPLPSPASRSARKPKGEGHARRAEILAVAERIFVEHGYEGATIRKIAEAVGLSSTALYMHFPDKSAILNEISKKAFQALITAHRRIIKEDAPPDVRLRRLIEGYIQFGFDNPNAYRLTYMTPPSTVYQAPEISVRETGIELFRLFAAVVEETVAAGRMKGDPNAIAQAIWATGHGVVALSICKPNFDWIDRHELVRVQMDALFAGFVSP